MDLFGNNLILMNEITDFAENIQFYNVKCFWMC